MEVSAAKSFAVLHLPTPTPKPGPANEQGELCTHCYGTGRCEDCINGECGNCFGERTVWCPTCTGNGRCQNCINGIRLETKYVSGTGFIPVEITKRFGTCLQGNISGSYLGYYITVIKQETFTTI